MIWLKRIAIVLMPLALTSCFLSPGAFTSNLDLRRDGSFTFSYKGEIIVTAPDDMVPGGKVDLSPWKDDMAYCYGEPEAKPDAVRTPDAPASTLPRSQQPVVISERGERPCTKAEIAQQKKEYEASQAARIESKKRDEEGFAALFGFAPGDDAANQKIAARLMKQPGWKSATYQGKGVFLIDYAYSGKVGHDFVFPIFENSDVIFPFVTMRPRSDGSVMVSAPGLTGGVGKSMLLRGRMVGLGDQPSEEDARQMNNPRTRGVFTITTDGVIATNNTDDGPRAATNGQKLVWDIDASTNKIPESLIRLN